MLLTGHKTTKLFVLLKQLRQIISRKDHYTHQRHNTCFRASIYSLGIQDGNLHQTSVTTSRVTCFISGPTQEPALATANTGNIGEMFRKNEGEWTGKVEISSMKIFLAISEASMAIF